MITIAFTRTMHTVKSFTNAQLGLNKYAFLYPLKSDQLIAYKDLTSVVLVNLFPARILPSDGRTI